MFGLWFSMHCVVSLSTFAITSLTKKYFVHFNSPIAVVRL